MEEEIISRQEAIELSLKHYFTGKPCHKGHIAKRYVTSTNCAICARERSYQRSLLPKVKAQNKANKQKEEYKKKQKEYAKSPERRQIAKEKYRIPEVKEKIKKYRESRRDIHKAYMRQYYDKNKESMLQYAKEYLKNEEVRERRREYIRNWTREFNKTEGGRITATMRKLVHRIATTKGSGTRTAEKLGYTKEQFKRHIELQFLKGMTWENHGEWHIDHIIPVSHFLKNGIDDPKVINRLSNLKPIWAKDNLSKHAKITSLV